MFNKLGLAWRALRGYAAAQVEARASWAAA